MCCFIDKSRKQKKSCNGFGDEVYQNVLQFLYDNIEVDQVLEEVC